MILDRCQNLKLRIDEKKHLEQSVNQIRRFRKVRDVLVQHRARLASLVSVWRALREAGIPFGDLPTAVRRAVEAVSAAQRAYLQSADSVIDERAFALVPFGQAMTAATDAFEEALTVAWQRHVALKVPPANREVQDALATAFPREIRIIRVGGERIEQLRQILPKSRESIQELEEEVRALQQTWGQLGGGEVPPAVLTFLKAAATTSGAGLDLLTEEVRGWLTAHGIVRSFAIKVAAGR
jgi:hypothetical protein